jgi:hypothetical protein
MKNFLDKIKISFINSTKGLESFSIVTWGWGVFFYFLAYYFFDKLLIKINAKMLDRATAILVIIYFIWHIYATIKCAPKVPKLSKEEKEQLKIQNGGSSKAILRKLFLQEPITKMNPRNILIVIDLYFILHFYSYIG